MFVFSAWLFHLAAVTVEGSTVCPPPEAVQGLVAAMLDGQPVPSTGARRASLSQNNRGLLVTLRGADGAVLAEKQFLASAGCDDLASAAAVVIATWLGELAGETDLTLQALPREPAPPVAVVRPWEWRLSAAAALTRAGSSLAPGLWIDASAGRGALLQGVAAAFVEGAHEQTLGIGQAGWQRTGLGAGPRLLWQAHHLWVGGDVLGHVAWLRLRGEGQPQNVKDQAFDMGVTAALRVGWQMGSWSPFLSFLGGRSLVSRTLAVEPAGEAHMPATLLALMAGFSWRL
ncbi:MAG: hypothetical protein SF187_05165 [Deltaproteobacteria bacterium]|nr:hypothetical protein [Deltaproteobacteria bacterium]